MRAALWFRVRTFASRHANKIWLGILAAGLTVALFGIRNEADVRRQQDCEALRNGQRVDRLLIDTVLDSSSGPGIPLLDIASFAALPPEVQTYVRDLAAASAPDPKAQSLAERLEMFRDEHLSPSVLPDYCRAP
jgi:hypothetical protein